ncbi:hypothetical protein GCM10023334_102730 [Nonomuraea thailandensis]
MQHGMLVHAPLTSTLAGRETPLIFPSPADPCQVIVTIVSLVPETGPILPRGRSGAVEAGRWV